MKFAIWQFPGAIPKLSNNKYVHCSRSAENQAEYFV